MAKQPERAMAAEVEELRSADLEVLRQRWSDLFARAPSSRVSRDVLIRGVAFRLQEETYGGLSRTSRRQLGKLANDLRSGTPFSQPPCSFKPGTRLIREWKGKVHEVVIAGDTYIWGSKHYRSLSEIARAITGTRWSGPRFFGLGNKRAGERPGTADD
jgi:hypothetical protein